MAERRSQVGARGRQGRPLGVTVVVVVVALAGLLDVALAALVAIGAQTSGGSDAALDGSVPVGAVVGVLGGLGIAQLVLALLLARGRNSARLVLTLVLVLRQAYGWYLVADLTDRWPIGVLTLASTTLTVLLLWNRSASAFFEQDRERALADSLAGRRTKGGRRRRSGALLLDYAARLAVLAITVAITPGVYVESSASLLLAVAAISLAAWVLTPLLVRVAGLFGWFGALLLALFANAAVIGLGMWVTPGFVVTSVGGAVLASWVYALVMTVLTWLVSVDAQDYLTVHATRMSMRGGPPERSDVPGVLFVQLDGVPAPLLENEVRAGNLPTISRWIRSGSHTWREWTARVPSTTPVSQAGLLHGDTTGIPAFRWYDRELGRLVVANRPADAALIEARRSDGRGLLADDGVSVSNLFSGDAPVSLLSMSGLRERGQGLGPSRSYAAFFTHPAGFMRAVILTVGEMV
ncbi:MAG TPA: hypothetical protein VK894_09170, partial [Jiangellales bacterium]|nr:hypothetical protein [Jiangellales bacterium]